MGGVTSLYLAVLILLNALVQAAFLFITVTSLSERNISEETVGQLQGWRRSIAHDHKHYNARARQSLARRVCLQDAGLEIANEQSNLYGLLRAYVGTEWGSNSVGPLMCAVAVTMWILTVSKEVNSIVSVLLAVLRLPLSSNTQTSIAQDSVHIQSISAGRRAAVILSCVARFAVCAVLAGYGGVFLVHYSLSIADLLLNAVALEFVTQVDELVHDALAPASVRRLTATLTGLTLPKPRTWQGLDGRTAATFLAASAAVGGVLGWILLPHVRVLVQARDALCAGDLDFVHALNGFGVLVWAYPSNVNTSAWSSPEPDGGAPWRNFPDGKHPTEAGEFNASEAHGQSAAERTIDLVLRQLGREPHRWRCSQADFESSLQTGCFVFSEEHLGTFPSPHSSWPHRLWNFSGYPCCWTDKTNYPNIGEGQLSLRSVSSENPEAAMSSNNPSCADFLSWGVPLGPLYRDAFADAVEQSLGSRAVHPCGGACPVDRPLCAVSVDDRSRGECVMPTSCQFAAAHCHDNTLAGLRARQMCPQTCGCNRPRAPLALAGPAFGCGSVCLSHGSYLSSLSELPCEDVAPDDAAWLELLGNLQRFSQTLSGDAGRSNLGQLVLLLRRFGCSYLALGGSKVPFNSTDPTFLPYLGSLNYCAEGGSTLPIKALSYFCPVSCGCRAGDAHCPGTCPPRDAATPLCPDYQRFSDNDRERGLFRDHCPVRP